MFTEDLDLFYDEADFAVKVRLDGREVAGQFTNAYDDAGFIQSSNPGFSFQTAKAPDVSQSSILITDTQKYNVIEVQPDGTGTTFLELRKTS